MLRSEGGLVAGFSTLGYSCRPCAEVLSVAGFSVFGALFPLGSGLFSAVKASRFNAGFEQFCTILTVLEQQTGIIVLVQHCSLWRVYRHKTGINPSQR